MKTLTMSTALLVGISYFGVPGSVSAQEALSSCNPATGLTPSGAQCVSLTPIDPTRYQTPIDAAGASNYQSVNVGELAETYECNRSGEAGNAYGTGGAILIEDCGEPLVIDPSTLKEFVGYAGNPAPTPIVPATYTPPPVALTPAPLPAAPAFVPPAPIPPAPAVYAATPFASAGLGSTGLIAAGLGAAAIAGIAALALSNDSDSTPSTQ